MLANGTEGLALLSSLLALPHPAEVVLLLPRPNTTPVTLARRKAKTWTCPKCKRKNEARTSSRTCQYGCGATKPPRKLNPLTTPVDPYDVYELLSVTIHGGDAGACGVCGRPPKESRNNDRDHCHRTGRPRGLACPRCNKELLRHATLEEARAVVAYLERVEDHYGRT